jgi:glycosyltransferase involved in cell wall biosynthesis
MIQKANKILWLSPNFNHYKARFLNKLAAYPEIELTVLSGKGSKAAGHVELKKEWSYNVIETNIPKQRFGYSFQVMRTVIQNYRFFDWIMIPREKKNLLLIVVVFILRRLVFNNSNTKLFTYNHPFFGNTYKKGLDSRILSFLYSRYDKVIFYTEKSYQRVIEKKLITKTKASWANNTLDSSEIKKHYTFSYPNHTKPTILFISRLIENKDIPRLFEYYVMISKAISARGKELYMDIIGDGPLREYVEEKAKKNKNITYHGAINDESVLCNIFKNASFVFVPGHSGLGINHAFLYGRPYITIHRDNHAPEIDYVNDGKNGYILSGKPDEDIPILQSLLSSHSILNNMCEKAYSTGNELSVENWCEKVLTSLET